MKLTFKIFVIMVSGLLFSCDNNDNVRPADTSVTPVPSSSNANFLFINAVPDGGSLDLYVNGVMTGASVPVATGQVGYTSVSLPTSGFNSIANTAIRAQATSGSIGGILGSANMLYRAGSTSINNFVAAPNTLYTLLATDSINRPIPSRTFSVQASTNALAADVTYYNTANGQQISNDAFKALSSAQQSVCAPLGSLTTIPGTPGTPVPAGTTDAGGPRFLLLTDAASASALFPATGIAATQSAIRFVNAVPNSYATVNNVNQLGGASLYARLRPSVGSNLTLANGVQYVMNYANLNPSVGSRSTTIAFSPFTTPATTTYTLEISTSSTFATISSSTPNLTFTPGKVYTVVARGIIGKSGATGLGVIVVQHN